VRYRAVAVLCALAAFVLIGAAPAGALAKAPAPAVRVLIVGDSISQGLGGDWTWRHWLWKEFERQQVPVDFVGPRSQVATGYGTRYEGTTPWDSDHAALGGATTDTFLPQMTQLVTSYPSDVMILEIGLNDLRRGATPATVAKKTQQLMTTAWATRPHLRVVLAQIPNVGNAALDASSKKVNDAMAAWAVGKQVRIAHNRTGEGPGTLAWSTSFTFDHTHANATGQTLYAHRFAQALYRMAVLPQAPDAYRVRTWAPNMVPAVARTTGGATVTWKQTTSEVAVNFLEVLVDGRVVSPWIKIPVRGDTQSLSVRLTPGTHKVQLAPKRGTMVGAAGTAALVSVP